MTVEKAQVKRMRIADDPRRLSWFLAGALVGGLGIYFFDPRLGADRRMRLSHSFGDRGRQINEQVKSWLAKASQSTTEG